MTLSCSHLLCGKTARLPLAGRRPGYPVFTSFLPLVVPGNTELFFFFLQVGRLEMGFNFWNSFLAPVPKPKDSCGVYQGVSYWRLVPKTNGRRDMTLCFIAVNAWAHVTSGPSRKVGESWLFLAVLPLIDISYNEVLLPQLLNESTSSRVWNLREETLTQELNSPNIIKRCTIFWGGQL